MKNNPGSKLAILITLTNRLQQAPAAVGGEQKTTENATLIITDQLERQMEFPAIPKESLHSSFRRATSLVDV